MIHLVQVGRTHLDGRAARPAQKLPQTLPLKGVTITGDAIFTQKAICQAIVNGADDAGRDLPGSRAGGRHKKRGQEPPQEALPGLEDGTKQDCA